METLETERLRLRPWRVEDAPLHRRLWAERDPRVPAHRRLSPDGHPTVAELEDWVRRDEHLPTPGLLVVERTDTDEAIGYCGLVPNSVGRPEEPELAYEFLQRSWHHGFATEAAGAVVAQARRIGYGHLASTVREWNTASLRVLEKLGFVDTGEREEDAVHGASLLLRTTL
ncbi:GNAT family N-acetyltransferase [Curtobacterium sp. PhB136]|uniref:GNAT family N-acetyltransferase n=1 Tax=Curtobacterium sp. PhB136 TaxID=2485181 RepID=UPI0010498F92|nr:GNAT family N-acetyltransferase [Curtobacterium sp. PhB136]TCK64563.1 RimJ/RimL family protein N-acetyltransferase [Curtobacterium sp. PhB136]